MKIAYLVNQYPKVSHSFIRRELQAVEALGHEVIRISIQPVLDTLADPDDQAESKKTHVILQGSGGSAMLGLLGTLIKYKIAHPMSYLRGWSAAWRLGKRSDRGRLRHLAYLAEACHLVNFCQAHNIDHVHAHFGTNSAAVAMLCKIMGGPSYSFTVHGPEEFDKATILGLDQKIHHAAFVAAISSFGGSQLYRWCDRHDWPKVQIVHCGLDAQLLEDAPEPIPTAKRLVCVGRLCEQKGQLLLLDAAAEVAKHESDFELVLAGDGEMRPDVEKRIAELGLEKHVRITGWLSGDKVRSELLKSRAMVLPSFAEGLPVVIMEALALRRPVISTYVAGIPELVKPNEMGWLVPAGDVSILAQAMREALNADAATLSQMGERGHEAVLTQHDVRKEAQTLAALIESAPSQGASAQS